MFTQKKLKDSEIYFLLFIYLFVYLFIQLFIYLFIYSTYNISLACSIILTFQLGNIQLQLNEGFIQKTSMFWTVFKVFHCREAEL